MSPKFSLQNVLDLRHGKVELLEIELGKLHAIHQETQSLLASLKEYQDNLLDQLSTEQTGEIDMVNLNLLRLNILQINKHIEMATLEFKKQSRVIDDKRIELIQAKQSEETLEILKRNRHEIYVAEQVQIEAQVQDDIYIARAFRNQQQGA
jgi:flagellar export protein FliJ